MLLCCYYGPVFTVKYFSGRVSGAFLHQEELNLNLKGNECLHRGTSNTKLKIPEKPKVATPLQWSNRLKEKKKKVKVEMKLTKRGECGRIWREMKSMWVRVNLEWEYKKVWKNRMKSFQQVILHECIREKERNKDRKLCQDESLLGMK